MRRRVRDDKIIPRLNERVIAYSYGGSGGYDGDNHSEIRMGRVVPIGSRCRRI